MNIIIINIILCVFSSWYFLKTTWIKKAEQYTDLFRFVVYKIFGCRMLLRIVFFFVRHGFYGWRWKHRAALAQHNMKALTGKRENMIWPQVRRLIIENAVTRYGCKAFDKDMDKIVGELNAAVAPLIREGKPVIFAPLHMVSDTLAVFIAARVTPGKAAVVVSSSAMRYNQQDFKRGGIHLTYCSVHQDNILFAEEFVSILSEVKSGKSNLIVFPDITPEYTGQTDSVNGSRLSCHLFNRAASVHAGTVRLGRILGADIVPFWLRMDKGKLVAHIESPLNYREAEKQLPRIIENALRRDGADWLLWHNSFLFFY